jgi:RNA polymerase sigma factor (sigma-70 family)
MVMKKRTGAVHLRPHVSCSHPLGDAADNFADVRPRLLGVAARILGSRADAEDIVQEVWLRWQGCDRDLVRNSTAFLVTATTRLAITAAQSARCRHETYVGEWPREPVATDVDPIVRIEREETLKVGIRVLLERLSPIERAVYVLRVAFQYPYDEVARMLRLSPTNTRQVLSRASRRVACERHGSASTAEQQRLLRAFVAAAQRGELNILEEILAADIDRRMTESASDHAA